MPSLRAPPPPSCGPTTLLPLLLFFSFFPPLAPFPWLPLQHLLFPQIYLSLHLPSPSPYITFPRTPPPPPFSFPLTIIFPSCCASPLQIYSLLPPHSSPCVHLLSSTLFSPSSQFQILPLGVNPNPSRNLSPISVSPPLPSSFTLPAVRYLAARCLALQSNFPP